jgi:hypothetical protein
MPPQGMPQGMPPEMPQGQPMAPQGGMPPELAAILGGGLPQQ